MMMDSEIQRQIDRLSSLSKEAQREYFKTVSDDYDYWRIKSGLDVKLGWRPESNNNHLEPGPLVAVNRRDYEAILDEVTALRVKVKRDEAIVKGVSKPASDLEMILCPT